MEPQDLNEGQKPEGAVSQPAPEAPAPQAAVTAAPTEEPAPEAPIEENQVVHARDVRHLGDVVITNQQALRPKAIVMYNHLKDQPKQRVHITRIKGEGENAMFTGSLNGLEWGVPKGRLVLVPDSIAEIWYNSVQVKEDITINHPNGSDMLQRDTDAKSALNL